MSVTSRHGFACINYLKFTGKRLFQRFKVSWLLTRGKKKMELPETFLCCVCLEAMVHAVSLMPCHDTICAKCARTIIRSKKRSARCCPLCRSRITSAARDESFSTVVRSFLDFVGKWKFQQHTFDDKTNCSNFQKQSLLEDLVKRHQELAAQCCLSEDALRALITLEEWNERGHHDGTLADRLRAPPRYLFDRNQSLTSKAQPLATTTALPIDESNQGKRYVGRLSTWNGIYGQIRGEVFESQLAFQSQFDFILPKSEILFVCSDLDLDFNDEESVCCAAVSFRVERVCIMGPHWEWRAYDAVFLGPDTAVGLYAQHRKDNVPDEDPRALIENVVVDPTLPGMLHVHYFRIRLEGKPPPTSHCVVPREVVFRLFTSKRTGDVGIVGEALCWLDPRWKTMTPVAVKDAQDPDVGIDYEEDSRDDPGEDSDNSGEDDDDNSGEDDVDDNGMDWFCYAGIIFSAFPLAALLRALIKTFFISVDNDIIKWKAILLGYLFSTLGFSEQATGI
ncbi:Hypothetical protein, putative [Bodo saltans]|uniref:RING-type domain-containing protein n=1 Tax=Bodo saltans TaxID=75058 RepID=A0A0S4JY71_BODSA|nr:Hypothetical protein, putative [Bodo saltans]|eukprot:CUG94348.1 Hypothetical protein, putative [Bodo saltans]